MFLLEERTVAVVWITPPCPVRSIESIYMSYAHKTSASDRAYEPLKLGDGAVVVVREVRSEDAPALRRLVGRLGERSAYLRYFGPMRELSETQAKRFAEVDGKDRFALVALDPDDRQEIVAVVRYERKRDSGDRAEYAALVEDRFQGRGLGISMTRILVEAARRRDIRRLDALVLRENTAMLHLLKSLGLPERTRWEDGVEHVEVELRPKAA